VLVVGGSTGAETYASTEVWDPAAGTFSPTGSLIEGRYGHSATTLADGRVLVAGGFGEALPILGSAEVWDPATGTFSPTGSLVEARMHHTATALPDGRVLVVGGGGEVNIVTSTEVWEPGDG